MQAYDDAQPRVALAADEEDISTPGLEDEPRPSTSAETIRHLPLHLTLPVNTSHTSRPGSPSQPSSPRSSLPSPSSPSGDSVSSFPSVSSSFLFSSGPGSPPHLAHHSGNEAEHEHGDSSLIIPSLTLPSPLRRPTPYGQGLGEVRLLVLGRRGAEIANVVDVFTDEEYDDIVEIGQWEEYVVGEHTDTDKQAARVLRVSTDWIEHGDDHGLEKHEPSRNMEIMHLRDYGADDDPSEIIRNALTFIHSPFRSVLSVVHPDQPPNDLLAILLSSSTTPLYTAMILVSCKPLTPLEHTLIVELSTHIPLIVFPPVQDFVRSSKFHPSTRQQYQHDIATHPFPALKKAHLSSIRAPSPHALRDVIFHRPESLAALRREAADRFLRWREVERAVGRLLGYPVAESPLSVSSSQRTSKQNTADEPARGVNRRSDVRWDRSRWEAEWEGALSTDVAKTVRTRRATERRTPVVDYFTPVTPMPRDNPQEQVLQRKASQPQPDVFRASSFDPLHLPSLLAFSLSLLAPLKAKVAKTLGLGGRSAVTNATGGHVESGSSCGSVDPDGHGWALAGAFCAGVGVGMILMRM